MNNPKYIVRKAHRWLGLLLGAQVMLWMASGVVMSWFDIDVVRGEATAPVDIAPPLETRAYAAPGGIVAQMEGRVTEIRLRAIRGRLFYEAIGPDEHALFNAFTGEPIELLDEAGARRAAQVSYVGEAKIERIALLENPPQEYRGPRPVWRADFDDRGRTRLYISPDTGEVLSRRNRIWRIYDFFWMLHIMDYEDRSDFNNPLIRVASATGVLFALTGVGLLAIRFWPKRRAVPEPTSKAGDASS